jgi:hypothetical protein
VHVRCFITQLPLARPLLTDTSFSLLSGLPAASTLVSLVFYFRHQLETRLTYSAFVGIPHANILTYWHSGTSFCILDSTIHPYAFHNDRIGCIYAPLSLLIRLPDHSVTKFLTKYFDPSRSLRNGLSHLSGHSLAGTDHPRRSAHLRVPD